MIAPGSTGDALVDAAMRVLIATLPGQPIVPRSAVGLVVGADQLRVAALPAEARRVVGAAILRARVYTAATGDLVELANFEADWLQRAGGELEADLRSMCHAAVAEAYIAIGHDKLAHSHAWLAEAYANEAGDDACRYRAVSIQACAQAFNGEFARATQAMRRCRDLESARGWTPNTAALPLVMAEVLIACARLDVDALIDIDERLSASPAQGPVWLAYRHVVAGWTYLLQEEYDRALTEASQVTGGSDTSFIPDLVTGLALSLQALAHVHRGEPGRALNVIEGVPAQGDHAVCLEAYRATAHLQLGEEREALLVTDQCVRLAASHNLRTIPAVLLRRAVANLRLQHVDSADRAFAEAFHLMRATGTFNPLVGLPIADLEVLCSNFLRSRPEQAEEVREFRRAALACPITPEPSRTPRLTPRERIVAMWLRTDLPLAGIADRLYISGNTLKTQLRAIYSKLDVSSREDAVEILERSGFYERTRQE